MRANQSSIIFSLSHSLSKDWVFWILKLWNMSNRQEFAGHFSLLNNLYFCYLSHLIFVTSCGLNATDIELYRSISLEKPVRTASSFLSSQGAGGMDIAAWDSSQPGQGTVAIQKSCDISCLDGWIGAALSIQTSHFCSFVHYEENFL